MADSLPPKIRYAYWFQGLNAVSYQICLGSPLILFANQLGASAVVLGVLAGLAPLTSILQLAVARYASQIGYRNLMLRGWSTRVAVLIFLVVLPLVVHLVGAALAVWALLAILLIFNLSRAIAVCSWLPWIAAIVPKSLRGFYLSWDRLFVNGGTLVALAISGVILLERSMVGYAAVFFVSFLGGVVSLYFLNRIPEPQMGPAPTSLPPETLQWRGLLADKAFSRLIAFSATVQLVIAANSTFTVVFVRDQVGMGNGPILWLTAGAAVLSMAALQLLRRKVDLVGSKPLLAFVLGWWAMYFVLWFVLSVNGISQPVLAVCLLMLANGFFAAVYDLALTRLLMNIAGDRPASAQYFALHSVVSSTVTGLAPIGWGFLLDSMRGVGVQLGGLSLSHYSYLFGFQWLLLALVSLALIRLREASAQSFRRVAYEVFVHRPAQTVLNILPALMHLLRRGR